ncbi:MAG: GHKL domain-containing protein [Desulfobacterium sp.]|nr:GHKL domain-containing protein [Desulfobacterium sp.]
MSKPMYRVFRQKMIIITLLISFVPLTLLGYTIYYGFAKAYCQRVEQQMTARVTACSQSLDLFLEERKVILSAIAKSGSLSYYNDPSHLRELFETINNQTGGGLVDLGVIDSHGDHLAYVGPYSLEGFNYREQAWFNLVMAKGIYVSDVYMGFRQMPHFVIAVKAGDAAGDWILRATIDPEIFARIVTTAQTGKTGDAFIINSAGICQSPSRFNKKEILAPSGLDPSRFGSSTTVVKKNTVSGLRRVHVGKWINNGNWLLVVTQDPDENLPSFSDMKTEEITIFSLALFAIVVTTVVTTGMSVNKLQERDRELEELNAHLIQTDKMAALGKMAAGVAHEINNPLGIIATKAGWMRDLLEEEAFRNSDNFKEYDGALRKIEEHVERAGKVTHNMLGFARSMEPVMERVNINGVLKKTLEFLDHHAQINNIRINTGFDDAIPEIMSDRSQLQQVFLNIINNAVDAIEKQGTITVETAKNAETLVIDIKDTGKGIPDTVKKRIFDPFFTTKAAEKGTGLGLSITYRIIEKLGGTIRVKSRKGKGTCFTVVLPLTLSKKTIA